MRLSGSSGPRSWRLTPVPFTGRIKRVACVVPDQAAGPSFTPKLKKAARLHGSHPWGIKELGSIPLAFSLKIFVKADYEDQGMRAEFMLADILDIYPRPTSWPSEECIADLDLENHRRGNLRLPERGELIKTS